METNIRVLVVEDYPDTQKLLKHILEKQGYVVDVANNGKEGVELFERARTIDPYDLVLIDFFMPVMDGLNATRILRESGAELPIIMLTANNDEADHGAARAAGCSELMLKPFQKNVLLDRIKFWLNSGIKFVLKQE